MRKVKGAIYVAGLGNGKFKAFQFIEKDRTQLSSDVIRVFKNEFASEAEIASLPAEKLFFDFETHTSVSAGERVGMWRQIGKLPILDHERTLFRVSDDQGVPGISKSSRWRVWYPNQEMRYVGALDESMRAAEIGWVVNPTSLVERLATGRQTHFYPAG